MPLNLEDRMDTFKATAVLACVLGTPIATADIYQYDDCEGNGSLFLTELDAEPYADLSGLYLACAELAWANLEHADLSDTNLSGAALVEAHLSHASFHNTYALYVFFRDAVMHHVDLTDATIMFADVTGADLLNADLRNATLTHADFSGAHLIGADLTGVTGWNTVDWDEATYSDETVFPAGMDPDAYGMEYVEVAACPADFNGDTQVNVLDLLSVIEQWGIGGADANGDGYTNVLDLLAVINDWGGCP